MGLPPRVLLTLASYTRLEGFALLQHAGRQAKLLEPLCACNGPQRNCLTLACKVSEGNPGWTNWVLGFGFWSGAVYRSEAWLKVVAPMDRLKRCRTSWKACR